MQYVDALFDAMDMRGLKPRIDFANKQTRIYCNRNLGLPVFDTASRFSTSAIYFEYINYLDARKLYKRGCVAAYTNFNIVSNDIDSAFAAFTALKPILRAINTHKIEPKNEIMQLF